MAELESTSTQTGGHPTEKKLSDTEQVAVVKISARKVAQSGAQPHPRAKTPRKKQPEGIAG